MTPVLAPLSDPAIMFRVTLFSVPFTVNVPVVLTLAVSVTVCPAAMTTLSPAAGTPEGDQVEAVLQLPVATEVRVVCAKVLRPIAMDRQSISHLAAGTRKVGESLRESDRVSGFMNWFFPMVNLVKRWKSSQKLFPVCFQKLHLLVELSSHSYFSQSV